MTMHEAVEAAKSRRFDETLWGTKENDREEYAYRETKGVSCSKPGVGMITHPVCPFCGIRVGPDDKDFKRGSYCDLVCRVAAAQHFKTHAWVLFGLELEQNRRQECLNGAGI